jgi:hypothetical protein
MRRVWFRTIIIKRLAFHHRSFLLQSIVVSERQFVVLCWCETVKQITSWDHHRMNEVSFYILVIGYTASSLFHNMSRVDWMLTEPYKKRAIVSPRHGKCLPFAILLQLRVVNSKLYIKMYHIVQRKRNHCQILSLKNKIWLSLAVTSIYNIESIPHQVLDCCNLVSNRRNDGFPKVRRMVGGKDINSRKSIPRCAP